MVTSGLQRRLLESHLVIAFAGLLFVAVLFASATFLNRSAQKISDSVGPLPRAVLSLINTLQASVAANHGWVYVGDETFVEQNQQAWAEIGTILADLREAQQDNPSLLPDSEFRELTRRIAELRELQSGIEFKSAGIDEDARSAFIYHVQPLAEHLSRRVAQIAEDPHWLADPALARSLARLDKQLGETRVALSLAVDSHEPNASVEFAKSRTALAETLASDVFESAPLPPGLGPQLHDLRLVGNAYVAAADNALMLYEASNNRAVREFLFERAVPLSNSIIAMLQSVEAKAAAEVERRRDEMSEVTSFTLMSAVLAFAGLVVAAIIISMTNSSRLLKRLQSLSNALECVSGDGPTDLLQVRGDDEIASLTRMFNRMVLKLDEKQQSLRRYQNELERRVGERTRELKRAKEFAETTLESVADALLVVDASGVVSIANPAAARLLGRGQDAICGMHATELLYFDSDDETQALPALHPVEECLRFNRVLMPDEFMCLRTAQDASVSVKLSAAPISAENGLADGVIVILRDVSREIAMRNELAHRANHDSLTNLANRARFNSELSRLIGSEPETRGRNVVAFLDLDRFKAVNDTGGHAAGDQLLKELAVLLSDNLRLADLPARLGGDEFAVIFRNCTLEQAERAAMRLRDKIAGHRTLHRGQTFSVGVSVGLTELLAEDNKLSDLLNIADAACYEAKKAGRNAVRVAERHRVRVRPCLQSLPSQSGGSVA
ncbi:diguanylate cyclase [Granulosicoccaceae sp. 1_MG-2023]|nr:diguanylate cyclase [Granulosicoccaceae sp. 1_MG-2023]